MDTLSHYLWAVVIYSYFKKPKKWLWGMSGVMPDILSFGLLFIPRFITGFSEFEPGPPALSMIPDFVFTMYNITHSFIPIGIVALVLFFWKRDWWWITWGWFFHIITDIPTHTREFFPTPFLWPVATYTFNGFMWGTWWFMLLNYGLLGIAAFMLWRRNPERVFKPDSK